MKKYYLYVFIISLTSNLLAQNKYHSNETTIGNGDSIVYTKNDMKPLTGIIYNESGEKGMWKREIPFINGKREGLVTGWYSNGQLWYENNYKNNKPHGISKSWYENGRLNEIVNYSFGIQDGIDKWWSESGQLTHEWNFKNGKKEGRNIQWYDNGQLWNESFYINGQRSGSCKSFHENGKLEWEAKFLKGVILSEKCWDENGNNIKCE